MTGGKGKSPQVKLPTLQIYMAITTLGIKLRIFNFAKSERCRFPSRSTFQDAFLIIELHTQLKDELQAV